MTATPSSTSSALPTRPGAPTEAALDRAIDEARAELDAWLVTFTAGDGEGAEHGVSLLRRLATAVTDHSRALRGLPALDACCRQCDRALPPNERVGLICERCPDPRGRAHPLFCSLACCAAHTRARHGGTR